MWWRRRFFINWRNSRARRKKIVQQSCATCHGGQLQGGNAPALDKLGAKYSEEEILDIILNGKDRMPPGLLKGAEAEAAAGYLAGLK